LGPKASRTLPSYHSSVVKVLSTRRQSISHLNLLVKCTISFRQSLYRYLSVGLSRPSHLEPQTRALQRQRGAILSHSQNLVKSQAACGGHKATSRSKDGSAGHCSDGLSPLATYRLRFPILLSLYQKTKPLSSPFCRKKHADQGWFPLKRNSICHQPNN